MTADDEPAIVISRDLGRRLVRLGRRHVETEVALGWPATSARLTVTELYDAYVAATGELP